MYETYYTPSCTGGKVPIKWTAPEVLSDSNCMQYIYNILVFAWCYLCHRLFYLRNTPLTVMCGAMVWCCLRYGQLGRSHFQKFQMLKFYATSTQATTSPLPQDVQEPSTNSWSTAGINNFSPLQLLNTFTYINCVQESSSLQTSFFL